MKTLAQVLRFSSPIFFLVGALHLTLGLGAEVLLGATLTAEVIANPTLDSQNRFYGVIFMLYGVLFLLCASDIPRYAPVLRCLFWVFFAAGLARLVSVAIHGVPPPQVLGLLITELLLPPILHLWLGRVLNANLRSPQQAA